MINNKNINRQGKLLKWCTNITLVFTLFTFSGYVPENTVNQKQSTKTELRISAGNSSERTADYKKTNTTQPTTISLTLGKQRYWHCITYYEVRLNTRFRYINHAYVTFKKPHKDFRVMPSAHKTDDFSTAT